MINGTDNAHMPTHVGRDLVDARRTNIRIARARCRPAVAEMQRRVCKAETLFEADRALTEFEQAWSEQYPRAVRSVSEEARHLFALFNAPLEHREYLRTTNPIERKFREVRRWRRGCGAFADPKACDRVFYKVSMLLNERWKTKDLWDLPKRRDQALKARQAAPDPLENNAATRAGLSIDPCAFDTP